DNEVGYVKRFIARPLGHNAKMDWHAIASDCDHDIGEITLDQCVATFRCFENEGDFRWRRTDTRCQFFPTFAQCETVWYAVTPAGSRRSRRPGSFDPENPRGQCHHKRTSGS